MQIELTDLKMTQNQEALYAVVKKSNPTSTCFLVSSQGPINDFKSRIENDGERTVIQLAVDQFENLKTYYVRSAKQEGMTFHTAIH